jgi:hypothetical protein
VVKFYLLSNTVATLVKDQLWDYLYVMNALLLGINSPGTINTALTAYANDQSNKIDNSRNSYSGESNIIRIGSMGIHCDYRDTSDIQISWHIWAYTSASAGSAIGFPLLNGSDVAAIITNAGISFHDNNFLGGTWQDYLAGVVGISLGTLLRNGTVKPSQFGSVFGATLQQPYCDVMGCPDWAFPNRNGRTASTYLQDTKPWNDPIRDKDNSPACLN